MRIAAKPRRSSASLPAASATASQAWYIGGAPGDGGDVLLGHQRERAARVEGLLQHRARPGRRDQPEAGVEAVDVEQREDEQHPVVGAHRAAGVIARHCSWLARSAADGQHRAARAAGRPAGVGEEGQGRRVLGHLGRRAVAVRRSGADRARRRPAPVGRGDEQRGAGVGEDVLELRVGVGGVDRDDDQPGAQRAERRAQPGRCRWAAGRRPGRPAPARARRTRRRRGRRRRRAPPRSAAARRRPPPGASGRRAARRRAPAPPATRLPRSLVHLLRLELRPAHDPSGCTETARSGSLAWTGWGDVVTMGPAPQHARRVP